MCSQEALCTSQPLEQEVGAVTDALLEQINEVRIVHALPTSSPQQTSASSHAGASLCLKPGWQSKAQHTSWKVKLSPAASSKCPAVCLFSHSGTGHLVSQKQALLLYI